jgi:hypothetical protein
MNPSDLGFRLVGAALDSCNVALPRCHSLAADEALTLETRLHPVLLPPIRVLGLCRADGHRLRRFEPSIGSRMGIAADGFRGMISQTLPSPHDLRAFPL